MELEMSQFRWHEQFHGIPYLWGWDNYADTRSSMELGVRQFRWHKQLHVIPFNLEYANFADTSSFMEFHGTCIAPISMTRAVPWNSMELGVCQFHCHEQFHGIPWISECTNFDDTSSSMEFHETSSAPISMKWAVPFYFHGSRRAAISRTRAVPWISMELGMRQFRRREHFRGIPWNCMKQGVHQFRWHRLFHGIPRSAPISTTRAVPWNSMEFHGSRSPPISLTSAVPWNS